MMWPSIDLIMHSLEYFEQQSELYDYVVLLEPTSPLTKTIDKAIETLFHNRAKADLIVGVSLLNQLTLLFLLAWKKWIN